MLRLYLIAYNFICLLFWAFYLFIYTSKEMILDFQGLIILNIAQGLAVLEIFHSAIKWVKSPIISTIAQVFSRLLVLILIDYFFYIKLLNSQISVGIIIVSIAWGITEVVRYSHYFIGQLKVEIQILVWMRYSFFILLYPLGVFGEWLILSAPTFADSFSINSYNIFLVVILIAYVYYFPVLYKYMWTQRKIKLISNNG